MYKGWVIGFISSAVLFFIIYFVLSCVNYRRRFNEQYDVRNHFPYEFNYEGTFADNLLGNIALILSGALSVSAFVFAGAQMHLNGLLLSAVGAGVLLSILLIVINFVPLKTMKMHLLFLVLLFVTAFATPALLGFTFFEHYQIYKDNISLAFFIVSMVIAGFIFIMIMNPKLSFRITMQKATDEKGNEYYVRPKFIVVAFSEWLILFSILLTQLILIILITLIG